VRENVPVPREGNVYLIVKISVNWTDKWQSDIGSGVTERTLAQDNWNEAGNVCVT